MITVAPVLILKADCHLCRYGILLISSAKTCMNSAAKKASGRPIKKSYRTAPRERDTQNRKHIVRAI